MWFARVGRRDIHIAGKKTTPARMGDGAGIQYPRNQLENLMYGIFAIAKMYLVPGIFPPGCRGR